MKAKDVLLVLERAQAKFGVVFPDAFLPFALIRSDLDHAGAVRSLRIDCPSADFDFGALDFKKTKNGSR